ncbi:MAG: hypothetical protein AAF733_02300 [Verrucomicrobiota bacterium]
MSFVQGRAYHVSILVGPVVKSIPEAVQRKLRIEILTFLPTFGVMILDSGNRILDDMERRFGRLALPQLLRWIAGFQLLTWGLSIVSSDFPDWTLFDRTKILNGEVWRVVSWIFTPTSDSPLILITYLFTFFINDVIEGHWNSFRLNLYVITNWALLTALGFLPVFDFKGVGFFMVSISFYSWLFACATLVPNQIIQLFFVIPIRIKWIGFAAAAMLSATVLTSKAPILLGLFVIVGIAPYLIAFVPSFVAGAKQRSESAVRRHRFEQSSQPDSPFFHECDYCDANDQSDPDVDFRVNAEGRTTCSRCREEDKN